MVSFESDFAPKECSLMLHECISWWYGDYCGRVVSEYLPCHVRYGYTRKEIADYLKIHYTTLQSAK